MKKRKPDTEWRGSARPFVNWDIEKAKRLLKRGTRYLPLDLETALMAEGVDVEALKSKYQP